MDVRGAGEKTGKGWAEAHPGEAEEVRNVLMGDFAFRECHKEGRPDDIICSQCFKNFVIAISAIDDRVGDAMKANGFSWTVTWIRGVLA